MSRTLTRTIVFLAAISALAIPAGAQAQTTVGRTPSFVPLAKCGGPNADIIPLSSRPGSNPYIVPGAGVITSWSTFAAPSVGQTMKLKVFRPLGGTNYQVLAQNLRPLNASVLNTFPVSVPVQAGDVVGLNDQTAGGVLNACLVETGLATDVFAASSSD